MWMILGLSAIVTALVNFLPGRKGKNSQPLAFISLALTALTLCAFHSMTAQWVAMEDWAALMDVVPTLSKAVWILSGMSILINSICFLRK